VDRLWFWTAVSQSQSAWPARSVCVRVRIGPARKSAGDKHRQEVRRLSCRLETWECDGLDSGAIPTSVSKGLGDVPRSRHRVGVVPPPGCRDETTARSLLNELVRQGIRTRAGMATPAEVRAAGHSKTPVGKYLKD
jgi:hypothetical protein